MAALLLWPGVAGAGPRDDFEAYRDGPPNTRGLGGMWQGTPPYVAGQSVYSRSEFIHQDRPFDDTGGDTTPGNGTEVVDALGAGTLPLCSTGWLYRNGDFTYPSDAAYGRNAADIVEVRIAADDAAYRVGFLMQTMIDPNKAIVEMRIASGDVVRTLTVTGTKATLDTTAVDSRVDADRNVYEATIPRDAIPGGSWKVSALARVDTGAVVDLAFVDDEPVVGQGNCWHDERQSALIAAGTRPTATVDVDKLRAGATEPAPLTRGPMLRMYAPRVDFGEGTVGQARYNQQSSASIYKGSLQPYAAYVPDSYDPAKANPLILLLHCLACNHNIFHVAAWPGLKQLAESRGAPIVTPLAYGEGGHYESEAEIDVFEVLTDVFSRYRIDPDRVYLTGMSMGALGTFRLGELYPDLWARALGVGVYTTPFCVTASPRNGGCSVAPFNYFFSLENFRNVPFGIINGGLDELTPVTGSREIADRFAELGYAYRYWEYPTRFHEPALHGLTTDVTDPWFGDHRRVTDPARVTYVIDRSMRDEKLGIVHDRAYWLRDLRLADGVNRATIDATSGRGSTYGTKPVQGSGTSAAGSYSLRGLDPTAAEPSGRNELTIVARGLTSATVDAAAAGLSTTEPLAVTVDSDRELSLSILGSSVIAPAGETTHTVNAPSRGSAPPSGSLPATGGAGPLVGFGVLAALLAARRARR